MGSYSTLVKQMLALLAGGALLIWAAPREAKVWMFALLLFAAAFFIVVSLVRHRQITRLAEEVDEVLHSGRRVDFSNCREGDVAILSNELAKMVSRLARTRDQLEHERNALSDSLADISHQIRTPLTAAGLMLPTIERADDPRERIRATRELEILLERVAWLVTALLKIAKVDAGAMHFETSTVKSAEVARTAAMPLGTALDLHDIDLIFDLDEEATFTGDAMWSAEALENIVKNCMEHTPTGGSITIQVTENAISSNIRVRDTGPGISEEDLPHIFERFYRGHDRIPHESHDSCDADADAASQGAAFSDSPTQPLGFGIGLSLAQALISAQGGTLRACNAHDGGAQFDIAFPKVVV